MSTKSVKDQADLEAKFKEAGDKLVLIDFFATWCGPCRKIAPVLDQIAKDYASNLVVLKVDVDECESIAKDYSISSMPTFVAVKGGKKLDSFSGANPEKLKEFITKYL